MSAVKSVIKEELENSQRLLKIYSAELQKIGKGSLVKKNIKGNVYYYLNKREEGKMSSVYLGRLDNLEVKSYRDKAVNRRKYMKLIVEVKKEIKFLEKALSIYPNVVKQ